jgi:hypothetical protein
MISEDMSHERVIKFLDHSCLRDNVIREVGTAIETQIQGLTCTTDEAGQSQDPSDQIGCLFASPVTSGQMKVQAKGAGWTRQKVIFIYVVKS